MQVKSAVPQYSTGGVCNGKKYFHEVEDGIFHFTDSREWYGNFTLEIFIQCHVIIIT